MEVKPCEVHSSCTTTARVDQSRSRKMVRVMICYSELPTAWRSHMPKGRCQTNMRHLRKLNFSRTKTEIYVLELMRHELKSSSLNILQTRLE